VLLVCSGACIRQGQVNLLPHRMLLLRVSITLTFLCYLLTGASFALPSGPRCTRCVKTTPLGAMAPGTSCPLAHHSQHCHNGQQQSKRVLLLCPDGCLHHNSQEGEEVSPLAKFVFSPWLALNSSPRVTAHVAENLLSLPQLSFSPLPRPPSVPV
jgi:hypothetical protein